MATKEKKVLDEQVLRVKRDGASRALKQFEDAVASRTFVRTNAVPAITRRLPKSPS